MDKSGDLNEKGPGFKPHAELLLKKDSGAISNYDDILFDVLSLVGKFYDFSLRNKPKK